VFQGKVLPAENEGLHTDPALPGEICRSSPEGLMVATGEGLYLIQEVQCEGSRRLTIRDYLCGNPIHQGDVLGK